MKIKKSTGSKTMLTHDCLTGGDVIKYYDDYYLVLGETGVTQGDAVQVIAIGVTDGSILFEDESDECVVMSDATIDLGDE